MILKQQVKIYKVHAQNREAWLLAKLDATDTTWVSFSGHIICIDDQNNLLIQLSGCQRTSECHFELYNYRYFLLNREGILKQLTQRPKSAGLPGNMLARRIGESNYFRYSIRRDTIKAIFWEENKFESLFTIDREGNLITVN